MVPINLRDCDGQNLRKKAKIVYIAHTLAAPARPKLGAFIFIGISFL
jgi:hypothetical protein